MPSIWILYTKLLYDSLYKIIMKELRNYFLKNVFCKNYHKGIKIRDQVKGS